MCQDQRWQREALAGGVEHARARGGRGGAGHEGGAGVGAQPSGAGEEGGHPRGCKWELRGGAESAFRALAAGTWPNCPPGPGVVDESGIGLERLFRDVQAAKYHPLQEKDQHQFTGEYLLRP